MEGIAEPGLGESGKDSGRKLFRQTGSVLSRQKSKCKAWHKSEPLKVLELSGSRSDQRKTCKS